MSKAEETLFPDGIPAFLSFSDFARLLGVSRPQAAKIASERPEMVTRLPSMKDRRIRSELYFELAGEK
ncbi:hypothetical protein FIC87_12630 [Eggerthella lenta]|uniref:DNA-binding protein n=1 Tax=Eggerthella lenta TaxID=84112 RepID=A0A5C5BQQ1_EGGLN|nr:hypothetical protein [Eggerthella lenta]TNU89039.1 hypothetical protein FIC87_12630 [Eggerthella lenta]